MDQTGKIGIMCRVAALFKNKEGGRYTTAPLKIDFNAPAWIQKDRLFNMLVKDGSLEVLDTKAKQRALENDPVGETGADGKKRERKPREKKDEAIESASADEAPVGETRVDAE